MPGLFDGVRKWAEDRVDRTNKRSTILSRQAVLEVAWLRLSPKCADFTTWWANSTKGGRLFASDNEILLIDGVDRRSGEKTQKTLVELVEHVVQAGREANWEAFRERDKKVLKRLRELQAADNAKTVKQYVTFERLWNNFVYTIAEAPGSPLRRRK